MSIGTRNSLLLLVGCASIGLGATAVGNDAAPQQFNAVYDFTCDFSGQGQFPPPPTSVAAINDLAGTSFSCPGGGWTSTGFIMDSGLADMQEIHIGSFAPNAANRCGVIFARITLHGEFGDIYLNQHDRLFCPPGSFGLFGTSEGSINITGGTADYSNLIGRGTATGTFTVDFSTTTLVVHVELEGQAKFVN